MSSHGLTFLFFWWTVFQVRIFAAFSTIWYVSLYGILSLVTSAALQMNAVRAFVADMQAGVDRTDKDRDHVLTVTKHVLLDQLDKSDPPIV